MLKNTTTAVQEALVSLKLKQKHCIVLLQHAWLQFCDVPQNKDNEATCNILITVPRFERFPGSILTHFGQEHNV